MSTIERYASAKKMLRQNAVLALHALQDGRGIYSEGGFIRLVRVAGIKTDDWGAHVSLEVVPAPGFDHSPPAAFTVTARWDALWMSGRAVLAPEVAWLLLVRPDLVEEIAAAAAQGETGVTIAGHIYALASGTTSQQE